MASVGEHHTIIPPGAQPMHEPETAQQIAESNRRLDQMALMVQNWQPLLQNPIIPAADSSLGADDRGYDYPPSHVAWTGIRSAIDAMSMFFDSLATNQLPYETGHRVLARAALGGAAQALFVLAPSKRVVRRQNALRCAYDDLRAYDRALTDLRDARRSDELDGASVEEDAAWAGSAARRSERRTGMIEAAERLDSAAQR